jgi:hypothetical protein
MTDDQIRSLLARQPRAETLPHAAVGRWSGTHPGESRIAPVVKAASQPSGDGMPRWEGPFRYYVIPLGALTGKPLGWRPQRG